MQRTSFNDGWTYRPQVPLFAQLGGSSPAWNPVLVPHDAVLTEPRRDPAVPGTPTSSAKAFFPGGEYEYRKEFTTPDGDRRVVLEFDGVYRDARVLLNGSLVAHRPYGYSRFTVDVTPFLAPAGAVNEVRVEARSGEDSRWYTGCGIYRDTWIHVGGPVRVGPDGLSVRTVEFDGDGGALLEVVVVVENDSATVRTVDVAVELRDDAGVVVATGTWPITVTPGEPARLRQRLRVGEPRAWSPGTPWLHRCAVEVTENGAPLDSASATFGIRTVSVDAARGLRINGEPVDLRGACVHHDNGGLGAATWAAAEERRVRLLRDAGFNALRMAHHPMSPAMLDACDRLGVLVLDETFDVWTVGKSPDDYSSDFLQWWERDVEAMVVKDQNHPSVVMYSIGNEIPEVGTPLGAVWSRRIAERVRTLDPTRPITNGVNLMFAVLDDVPGLLAAVGAEGVEGGLNAVMAQADEAMNVAAVSDLVTSRTEEALATLDVAGLNYAEARYAVDAKLFPHRVLLGTETFSTHIDVNWALVREHPHVIGDFTWTGWDYLGEVGVGRPLYADDPDQGFSAPYPALVAGVGDLDITGFRRPVSYYREIVFGLRSDPYLAVQRPENHGRVWRGSPWAWSDTVSSWNWSGHEGSPVRVEVYSDAEEVELLLDGESLDVRPVGAAQRFRAAFETVYRPGELVAVARTAGSESGRHTLRTASGAPVLRVTPEPVGELVFVGVELVGSDGTLRTDLTVEFRAEVSGEGRLLAVSSGRAVTEEVFGAAVRRTWDGRGQAVVHLTGSAQLTVSAEGLADVVVALQRR